MNSFRKTASETIFTSASRCPFFWMTRSSWQVESRKRQRVSQRYLVNCIPFLQPWLTGITTHPTTMVTSSMFHSSKCNSNHSKCISLQGIHRIFKKNILIPTPMRIPITAEVSTRLFLTDHPSISMQHSSIATWSIKARLWPSQGKALDSVVNR